LETGNDPASIIKTNYLEGYGDREAIFKGDKNIKNIMQMCFDEFV
jgi:hypothetical protein